MDLTTVSAQPHLFFTTSASKKAVVDAYAMSVQGFFVKPESFERLESIIRKIMEYWKECIAPHEYGTQTQRR